MDSAQVRVELSEADRLELKLGPLAAAWYRSGDPRLIKAYHDTYHQLRALGWRGLISVEASLSDDLMPQDYLDWANQPDAS
jgi:hypothetical protein